MRQWVLTLPYRLRYELAYDHCLCRAVLGVLFEGFWGSSAAGRRRRGFVGAVVR